jgi:methylenetetrahydrofolate reductase (NADPH)
MSGPAQRENQLGYPPLGQPQLLEGCPVSAESVASDTTFSFELYPPRSQPAEELLYDSIAHLVASGPEFISVTYGANGSSRGLSFEVLSHLLDNTEVRAMAHLTCVGSSYSEASALIRQFLDAGITSFLALRGDPPQGVSESESFLGDLGSAGELVQLIHRVQAERAPFTYRDVPGFPDAKRLESGEKVTIAVAAFPNSHPRSRSVEQDLDTLLAKEAAGANLAISQLFFRAEDFLSFVEKARTAGVTMRILPGIMPVLSAKRLSRILELSGEANPVDLARSLAFAPDAASQAAVGIAHATRLGRDLLDGGASGLHLYTFNQHEAVLLRSTTRERLASLGLGRMDSSIPEAFSFYDHVLDAAVTVGAVPSRFTRLVKQDGTIDLAGYFTIARGEGHDTPAEMTKWFDSNYHFLVPEIGPETDLHLASDRLVREVAEAITSGFRTRPVIVGPVTCSYCQSPVAVRPMATSLLID